MTKYIAVGYGHWAEGSTPTKAVESYLEINPAQGPMVFEVPDTASLDDETGEWQGFSGDEEPKFLYAAKNSN